MLLPCLHRSAFLRKYNCGCGRTWDIHGCGKHSECALVSLNTVAKRELGENFPVCETCPDREVEGRGVVGLPTPAERREHRRTLLPPKPMTDARAAREGIEPIHAATLGDSFPVDRLLDNFDVCRNQLHTDVVEFNASIAIHNEARWMAYRQNVDRANIFIAKCNAGWEPFSQDDCRVVNIPMIPENQNGREDPRLFRFRGELWMAYTGYSQNGQYTNTVCIGRLNDRGEMDCHFPLHYEYRTKAEKNWVFFEHQGKLLCVYLSEPHTILEVDLFNCRMTPYVTQWESPYKAGAVRGGASPVLHNGQWYHWFHAVQYGGATKVYTMGVLTFEADPPFRVKRCCVRPLFIPDKDDVEPGDVLSVFPCGAVIDRNRWWVSLGHLDKSIRIVSFSLEDVEAELVPVEK